jgi:hypothetical protein
MKATSLYRKTSIGTSLQQALEDVSDELTEEMRKKFLETFDKAVADQFQEMENANNKAKLTGDCKKYNHCDEVWRYNVANGEVQSDSGGPKLHS